MNSLETNGSYETYHLDLMCAYTVDDQSICYCFEVYRYVVIIYPS